MALIPTGQLMVNLCTLMGWQGWVAMTHMKHHTNHLLLYICAMFWHWFRNKVGAWQRSANKQGIEIWGYFWIGVCCVKYVESKYHLGLESPSRSQKTLGSRNLSVVWILLRYRTNILPPSRFINLALNGNCKHHQSWLPSKLVHWHREHPRPTASTSHYVRKPHIHEPLRLRAEP